MMNKCNSFAGRFDGHGGAPEQYRRHRLMHGLVEGADKGFYFIF
jgi:hypothetical protein